MRSFLFLIVALLFSSLLMAQPNADGYDSRVDTVEVRFFQIVDAGVLADTTLNQDSTFTVAFETDSTANPIDPGYTHIGDPVFVKIVNTASKWNSGTFSYALINTFDPGKWDVRARLSYVDADSSRKQTAWSNSTVMQSVLNPYFIVPITSFRITR